MEKAALILEGGALRVLFTSGILDRFIQNEIEFEYVNGVSGGALCGVNYLSKQVGRTAETNLQFLHDKRYIGMRNLFFHGGIFNFDFLFGPISETYIPFDYETYLSSEQMFEIGATNCLTGKSDYFRKMRDNDQFEAVKASASMPLVSKIRKVDERPYLDGGISSSIPYQRAIDLGYKKIVVVLTQDIAYRKPENSQRVNKLAARYYRKYPEFVNAFITRPQRYNEELEEINRLEREGRLFVFRPEHPVDVSRVEKDKRKLEALYEHGKIVTDQQLKQMVAYLVQK
ncbi:patatin-like phospholipase family protein [Enterococcus larvae]|uniref:patatin-like phospholipase family protein n=1 Tax=Enterococcus larvae TaxID=2794352 RepID=UPI003F2BAA63